MKFLFILAAVFLFGFLIAIHEFGHFITAKLCGVRVNEFAIGMGPLLWQKEKGETLYSLRAFPVGGYCAMEGEDEDSGDERAFVRQGFFKKLLILAAGSGMNFIAGVCIILVLYSGAGAFLVDSVTGFAPEFERTGPSGLMEGDRFYSINGYRTYVAGDASLFLSYAGDTADIVVLRNGEKITLENVRKQTYTSMDGTSYTGFGLYVGKEAIPATLTTKLQYTCYQALDFVQLVWFSLAQLVTGGAGMQDLSGPVGIVSTITQVGEEAQESGGLLTALRSVLYFGALLAVNLAVMNLLPIPALDGGRIFFLLVDAAALLLFKRTVPEKYQAAVNTVGFVVLMGFMLLITFKDVFQLFQ